MDKNNLVWWGAGCESGNNIWNWGDQLSPW